ncbi:uncharacterized protein A1O5_01143 [Cladophialophora psammophila CBS 110553]|uniref:BTB domain-containing protein n=1 Tax=Cladophialophora psammophila CBS 110553 TaxID=1182543 RepID=W9XH17_9EURO|nr:uncharacterized protein A1O5_01143 [Cladophialophora psammophila CBS 110553]EXJ76635.1 hypothetical protein A1O5_01143 [Cladophialophora psammophila CBS 110553]
MSLNRDVLVFDPSGDVFLLLERDDDQSNREGIFIPADSNTTAPPDEVPENDANSIVLHADADEKLLNNKLASCSTEKITREIEMQVSSKHLSLASKVFGDMFHDKSLEGVASKSRELVTIPLMKDDFHSLEILLNIVHGFTRRVPRQVERCVLLQAVVLIDKYEFHEVAEVFTDMWFESLRPKIPQTLRQDLACWVYICWELGKSEEFSKVTEIAILETNYALEDQGALVPFWIVGKSAPCGILRTRSEVL